MAVNKRDQSLIAGETGWPFINYAQEERGFQTDNTPMSIPRFKFTYLVEFKINERVFENPVTNLKEFLCNGKIYTQLKRIDHPKPEMKVEKYRSYNKWILVPQTVEFQGASMTLDDDSTAVTQALWKEYLNFYSHVATVGENIGAGANSNLSSSNGSNDYQFTDRLTGQEMRAGMSRRPSLGMKLKPSDMRHFFDSIVIYDLGTEPDAINVYWFHHPVITAWNHENLDEEDRSGKVEVTANFEYESYYWTFGQNRGRLKDYIEQILGSIPASFSAFGDPIPLARRKDGIGRQAIARNQNQAVSTVDSVANTFASNPSLGDMVSGLPDVMKQSETVQEAQTFGLGEDESITMTPLDPADSSAKEPLLQSEIDGNALPTTREGVTNALNDRNARAEALLNEIGDRPPTPEERKKLGALKEEGDRLIGAARAVQARERADAMNNPATKSALENTKATQAASQPPVQPVANPAEREKFLVRSTDSAKRAEETSAAADRNRDQAAQARVRAAAARRNGFSDIAKRSEANAARFDDFAKQNDALAQRFTEDAAILKAKGEG